MGVEPLRPWALVSVDAALDVSAHAPDRHRGMTSPGLGLTVPPGFGGERD
ncbi:MAG TPA: hypothetical protein VMT79_00480 [Candidatus Binatia bacterium]|nr:hypothetical protein [Candidatus Binatia bacterium]